MSDELHSVRAEDLLERVRVGYRPPPQLTVSEFSDRELVVPSGPYEGTRWRTSFAEYQRGILDAFHEPNVEIVVVMGSSQWGKTSIALNWVAYSCAWDPCPILVVEPTEKPMATDFAKNRLDPLIRASPILSDKFDRVRRGPGTTSTTLLRTFSGGLIAIGGANSAASLASRSIRRLVLDEVDRYPPELPGEGSTIAIALKRTTAYRGRRQIGMLSSPSTKGAAIHTWFLRGDQRYYHVPCPACGNMAPYRWANIQWRKNDPETARIVCEACEYAMNDAERVEQLPHGEWVATKPGRRARHIVSFHMWEAYSPMSSLSEIVAGFLQAREQQKQGDKTEMHAWQNTTLGEPVEPDAGEGVETNTLITRREEYSAQVPGGVAVLTAGIDTQDDRLEVLVIGWGPGEESWIIDRHELPGDPALPAVWAMLDELLERQYVHETGQRLTIAAACIDSAGHRTSHVYAYCKKNAARRVYAIIGRDGQRPLTSKPSRANWGKGRTVNLYTIGTDAAKSLWMSRYNVTEAGPGRVHLPLGPEWSDEELAEQLTSERLVTKYHRGRPKQVWVKARPRNEALDMAVYGLGALRILNPGNLEVLLEQLHNHPAAAASKDEEPKTRSRDWIARERRRGWLRRR